MAKAKGLRGTALDLFALSSERRMERALPQEYRAMIRDMAGKVTAETMPLAIELAAAPALTAGYGPVKDEGVARYRQRVAELAARLERRDCGPADNWPHSHQPRLPERNA
jgi:indolepyruvate ferredoxin oxidoreductase